MSGALGSTGSAEAPRAVDSSGAARKRRPYGLLVLLALASVLVALEVGLRTVDAKAGRDADFFAPPPVQDKLYVPHPYIGYVLRPGAARDSGPYTFHINSLGFRGAERSARKPAGVYRILCLGGSTTYGTGATHDGATYPAQLEAMLNSAPPSGVTYEVWNCGVSGYNTVESLINLELRLLDYEPDALIVYHAANDARPIQARGFRPDYSHMRRSWVATEISPFERFLLRNWRTYAWIARGTDPEEQLGALANYVFVPGFKELHVPAGEGVPEEGVAAFLRNVQSIVAVARERGVAAVIATFATCSSCKQPDDEDFLATVERLNQALREHAAAMGASLVEVAGELSDRPELYDDWMHFNDEGSRAHARVVHRAAVEQHLLGL